MVDSLGRDIPLHREYGRASPLPLPAPIRYISEDTSEVMNN